MKRKYKRGDKVIIVNPLLWSERRYKGEVKCLNKMDNTLFGMFWHTRDKNGEDGGIWTEDEFELVGISNPNSNIILKDI